MPNPGQPTIQPGDTGVVVRRLQRALRRTPNLGITVSGVFDAPTETAVKEFQQGEGLVIDGIVGPLTWAALPSYREASPELKEGSKGPAVAWLQKAVAGADVTIEFTPYGGAIDGIFGPKTETAVRALQTWANLSANGVVDDDTWFTWMTPGSAQQLTLEGACGLTDGLL
jgi:peptidoglycan hydrolase-like protein with peptidoglycan-binding domain